MLQWDILELGPLPTNAYLLQNDAVPGEAILVDAPPDALKKVGSILEDKHLRLTTILLTHGHWDHMLDAQALKEATNAKVYAHQGDRYFYENPESMSPFMLPGQSIQAVSVDHWVDHKEVLILLGEACEVRHVPGHAPGNVLFYFPQSSVAFVGDVIFAGSVGRFDLPLANEQQLFKSIYEQVLTLPEDTLLLSGHGPSTTVGREASCNPFLVV